MFERIRKKFKKRDTEMEDIISDDLQEVELTDQEQSELETSIQNDPDYLQYAPEAVGYASREQQFNMYNAVATHIDEPTRSILDFGSGRGDFGRWLCSNYGLTTDDIQYMGIESNQPLVDACVQLNDGINVTQADWFNLSDDVTSEWCINVNSNNMRYDADISKTDLDYLKDTISKMYECAELGVIISLTSDITNIQDGLINWNAGDIFNWAQKTFGHVALDHTMSDDMFILIIYKF